MKNTTLKKIFATFFSVVILLGGVGSVLATDDGGALQGLNKATNKAYYNKEGEIGTTEPVSKDITVIVGKIIGIGLSFIGLIFFILMIYGGFLWMFARGEGAQVTKAKDLIEAASIGLIIILSAYAITSWLGARLTT